MSLGCYRTIKAIDDKDVDHSPGDAPLNYNLDQTLQRYLGLLLPLCCVEVRIVGFDEWHVFEHES